MGDDSHCITSAHSHHRIDVKQEVCFIILRSGDDALNPTRKPHGEYLSRQMSWPPDFVGLERCWTNLLEESCVLTIWVLLHEPKNVLCNHEEGMQWVSGDVGSAMTELCVCGSFNAAKVGVARRKR